MPKVMIYTTPSCVYCKMSKEFFTANGIKYEELNVAEDDKAREDMVNKSHQLGVPVIDIDGNIVVGFNKQELSRLLKINKAPPWSVRPGYMHELAIIGGGPAGVAAGVYAARKKIKTVLITDTFGGQSAVSEDVRNWIGTRSISGFDLAKNLEGHLRDQEDIDIKDGTLVEKIERLPDGFALALSNGERIETRFLLMTAGSRRKKLGIPGDAKFEGRGVVYCSTCDAPLFKGKTVAIVGGGNAALEAAVDSVPYAAKIYMLIRSDKLKGDQVTQDKVMSSEKVKVLFNAEPKEVLGDGFVTGLRYLDKQTSIEGELKVDGVFVEIGSSPNSDLMKGLGVTLTPYGEIVVDHKTQKAADGIWAAGDVSDVLYKQNNISMGDAVKAVLNIYETLHKGKKK